MHVAQMQTLKYLIDQMQIQSIVLLTTYCHWIYALQACIGTYIELTPSLVPRTLWPHSHFDSKHTLALGTIQP